MLIFSCATQIKWFVRQSFPPLVFVLYFPKQISKSSLLDRSGVSLESKPFIGVALFKCPADGTLEGWPVPLYLCTTAAPWKGACPLSPPDLSTMQSTMMLLGWQLQAEVCELTVGRLGGFTARPFSGYMAPPATSCTKILHCPDGLLPLFPLPLVSTNLATFPTLHLFFLDV